MNMTTTLAKQHLASPARPVSLCSLLAACAQMTKPLPVGSYCLGEADADGLPVVAKPKTRVIVAATAKDESLELLLLGVTAATTATGLSSQTGVNIITGRATTWSHINATISAPGEKLRLSAGSHTLFMLDDMDENKWTSAQVIEALTDQPAASVLVLTTPDHAKKLAAALPEVYEEDGSQHPYLRLVYGQGSQHLARISGIPAHLEVGQFVARVQSTWLTFTTANQEQEVTHA
jgi:hypothetical protein